MARGSRRIVLVSLTVLACVVGPDAEDDAEDRNADLGEASDAIVVFESRAQRSADGTEVPVSVVGDVSQDVLDQVARPWSYPDEPFVYQEEAWERSLDDEWTEIGYRITRMPREAPDAILEDDSVRVDPMLLEAIATAEPTAEVAVHVRLRDFPEWDVPPSPNGRLLAPEDIEAAASRRADAIAARQHLAEQMAAGIVNAVAEAGGDVVAVRGSSGWVWARMPGSAVLALAERDDVDELHWPDRDVEVHSWRQGDGRWSTRMNADVYLATGYDGGITNAGRHAWPSLLASVVEGQSTGAGTSAIEDEACAFYNAANCSGSSRIVARYKCDQGGAVPCVFVLGFAEADESNHATSVAAAILGDYTDDQGCGKELNDIPDWAGGCHSADWEGSATGMAPEARLVHFAAEGVGWAGTSDERFAHAIERSYTLNHADVINASWSISPACSIDPGGMVHDEVENAFDDGALVVASSGNEFGPGSPCNIGTPAGLIKSLAVNAFDAVTPSTCENDYHDWCLVDQEFSAMGGIDANVTGTVRAGAITANDIVGPNRVVRYTSSIGDYGDVTNTAVAEGTSYAAPTIAGLALLVKHRMLHFGHTWINSPGRLKTVMLAMADRHFSANPTSTGTQTSQKTSRGDKLYGFGRATLRRLHGAAESPLDWSILTWNTKTAVYTGFPLGGPLPEGVQLVKCVLQQHQDLSGSVNRIANFDLRLRVLQPVAGVCSSSGTQVGAFRLDNSYDAKSMVAFEDSGGQPLPGNCIEVKITPVSADVVTSTNTVCYYTGIQDDE